METKFSLDITCCYELNWDAKIDCHTKTSFTDGPHTRMSDNVGVT